MDETATIVAEVAEVDRRVELVRASHAGTGATVRRGMVEAHSTWRFRADADLSMPISELKRFLDAAVEILFLARRAGLVIREIPITWVYRRESKVNVTSGARAFLALIAVRWHQLRGAYSPRTEMVAALEGQSFL